MSITAVHVHENHVQVVHDDGVFVNVGYDGVAQSAGTASVNNHDDVQSELTRTDGETLDAFSVRLSDTLGMLDMHDDLETAEEIVRTQSWIVAKRKTRFGIG